MMWRGGGWKRVHGNVGDLFPGLGPIWYFVSQPETEKGSLIRGVFLFDCM